MPPRNAVTTKISRSGPFFSSDPAKTFRQNVRTMMDALAAEGEADVRAQLRATQANRRTIAELPGQRVADHAIGRTRALRGARWATTAVISVNNSGFSPIEGISLMAAASEVEGQTRAFRRTAARLRRARAVNAAELTKGLG